MFTDQSRVTIRQKAFIVFVTFLALTCGANVSSVFADFGTVKSHQKISSTEGDFTGEFADGDLFGWSVAVLDDLDGNGVTDIAVGATGDDDGDLGENRGAVYVLFLNNDGTVKSHQKISSTEGNFTGELDDNDSFGTSVAVLGDLNGSGVTDIVVGATGDDDGDLGENRGAVWVLFLNIDGTVKLHQKISATEGNFTGELDNNDSFGTSVAVLGDLDGNGVTDIAVGATGDDDGDLGENRGAVYVLFLNNDGTVKSHQKISSTEGNFTGELDNNDIFGTSVATLGDLDGNGVTDIVVGAIGDDDGGANTGAVYVLFLNNDGTVKSHQKISSTEGGFTGELDSSDSFGRSIAVLGDLNGSGVADIAVGATGDDDGGANAGAVYVLFLNNDGTVKSHQKISSTEGNFTGELDDNDIFGASVAVLGDLNGDGFADITVGAIGDDDGALGGNRGAVWVLFLSDNPAVTQTTTTVPDGTSTSTTIVGEPTTSTTTPRPTTTTTTATTTTLASNGVNSLELDPETASGFTRVTVTALNSNGEPVEGETITAAALQGLRTNVIGDDEKTTDVAGQVTFLIRVGRFAEDGDAITFSADNGISATLTTE